MGKVGEREVDAAGPSSSVLVESRRAGIVTLSSLLGKDVAHIGYLSLILGAFLTLGNYGDGGWGFLAFFILWQGAHGASLAPLLRTAARAA